MQAGFGGYRLISGVSEVLCKFVFGKLMLPKKTDGKDMIPHEREKFQALAESGRDSVRI